MSGVFIRILMTRNLDPVTVSNLKQEIASTRQSSSIASGVSNNTNASRAKSARPIMGRKSRVAVERREEHAAWAKICEELSSRMRSNKLLN